MAPVTRPNLGLYFDRGALDIPRRGLQSGVNFRIRNSQINNRNIGWVEFDSAIRLNGIVMVIDNFEPRGQPERLIFADPKDIYLYDGAVPEVRYLTPRYETGTASASGTAVTGVGTTWTTNVKAGDEISFGATGRVRQSDTWFTVASVNSNTSITLTGTAGTVVAGPYTVRKTFSGDRSTPWVTDVFTMAAPSGDDLWFATNGVDPIVTWNGATNQVTLNPQLGFTAKSLKSYSNMMLYANLIYLGVSKPTGLINSDIGQPLNAGSTGTGLSEEFKIFDSQQEIYTMANLGDTVVIYGARDAILAQFVGDPLVFQFRKVIRGLGPQGPFAVADYGDYHQFVGADTLYTFDGVNAQHTDMHVWRNILGQMDPARRRTIFSHFDEENGELIWSVPGTSDVGVSNPNSQSDYAWTNFYLEDTGPNTPNSYGYRQFPFTTSGFYAIKVGTGRWSEDTETWNQDTTQWDDADDLLAFPLSLVGNETGKIFTLNQAMTGDGVPLQPSTFRFGRLATQSGRERGLVSRVYPFFNEFPGTVSVNTYFYDHAMGTPDRTQTNIYDMSQPSVEEHFVSPYRVGRFFEVEFSTNDQFEFNGYDMDIRPGGSR